MRTVIAAVVLFMGPMVMWACMHSSMPVLANGHRAYVLEFTGWWPFVATAAYVAIVGISFMLWDKNEKNPPPPSQGTNNGG